MELLNSIIRESIDPDYRATSESTVRTTRGRIWVTLALIVIGVLLASAGVYNRDDATAIAQERADLINRIRAQQSAINQLQGQQADLDREISQLGEQALGDDPSRQLRSEMGVITGAAAVTGPGMVVTLDDPAGDDVTSRVIDQDLAIVADGLWSSGAEAVAINGHRLSARSAIRTAGAAITVNYVSLQAPYRVEAIGDPKSLPGSFGASTAAAWLAHLRDTYEIAVTITTSDSLSLPADPGLTLTSTPPTP